MKSENNIQIRQAMKEAGLTYQTLSEILGVSIATTFRMLATDLMREDEAAILKIIEEYRKGKELCTNQNGK